MNRAHDWQIESEYAAWRAARRARWARRWAAVIDVWAAIKAAMGA